MPSPFPISTSGRKILNAQGQRFTIKGRTSWGIINLTPTLRQAFLDDCVLSTHGFNTIECLIPVHGGGAANPPFDSSGNAPFLKTLGGSTWTGALTYSNINTDAPDFTTPNSAFWTSVDGLISDCASRNIAVILFPGYLGQGGVGTAAEGWIDELNANITVNGDAALNTYGAFIANRYKSATNIIWGTAGDTAGGFDAENDITVGIQSVSGQASGPQFTSQRAGGQISTDGSGALGLSTTINGAYDWATVIAQCRRATSFSTTLLPSIMIEEPYDEEGSDGTGVNTLATQPVRRWAWWGTLNAVNGYVYGNGYIWPFNQSGTPPGTDDYRNHLDTQATKDLGRLNAFIEHYAWDNLVPSGLNSMRTLVASGSGAVDSATYIAAAQMADGTAMIVYYPPGASSSFTLDLRSMTNKPIRARWWDPTNAVFSTNGSAAGTFSLSNSASAQSFTPPSANNNGDKDFVLVLDIQSSATASVAWFRA